MSWSEIEPHREPFWHLDEALEELELRERPSGPDHYSVRLKAKSATTPYHAKREIHPLEHDGTVHEVSGKAYILVPDITLIVGLFLTPKPSGAIGAVTASDWQGMRHHEIANVRGLYYEEDRALAIWEIDTWGRLEEFAHGRLWLSFETWLLRRFPQTTRIFADDAEPGEDTDQNRAFLTVLGYEAIAETHRIFAKEVRQR